MSTYLAGESWAPKNCAKRATVDCDPLTVDVSLVVGGRGEKPGRSAGGFVSRWFVNFAAADDHQRRKPIDFGNAASANDAALPDDEGGRGDKVCGRTRVKRLAAGPAVAADAEDKEEEGEELST